MKKNPPSEQNSASKHKADLSWFDPVTFNPADPDQMNHLFEEMIHIWMNDAHNLIASKIYDIRSKQHVVTSDIFNNAYMQFRKYYENKPNFRFKNIQEVKEKFTLYILYEIRNAIFGKGGPKDTLVQLEIPSNPEENNPLENVPAPDQKNSEQALFYAVSKLSMDEYSNCPGLTPLLLYELLIYWGDSPSSIADTYNISERTIRNYRTRIVQDLTVILKELGYSQDNYNGLEPWLPLPEEKVVRLQIQSIPEDNPTPLRQNDVIMSINGIVYEYILRLKSRLRNTSSNKPLRFCVSRRNNTSFNKPLFSEFLFELSDKECLWVLENVVFEAIPFTF